MLLTEQCFKIANTKQNLKRKIENYKKNQKK